MMKLKKVVAKGFRSIKGEETLLVDDRVTILIGANDSGKSNLLDVIQCLNDDCPIKDDDRNWDLTTEESVEIRWHFEVSSDELRLLERMRDVSQARAQQAAEQERDQDTDGPKGDVVNAFATVSFGVNSLSEVVYSRNSKSNEVRIFSLPFRISAEADNEKQLLAIRPRVEIFPAPTGKVIDEVSLAEIEKPQFEFMQGIFRLAGLWEDRGTIFSQNGATLRQLSDASDKLTKVLRDEWNQGKELKWLFQHSVSGSHIALYVEDPSVKRRYIKPSHRSVGFQTYFLLSMIIYARVQNESSYIYLFDEPGTYLHPSAQLDLQRSFEAIAEKVQIAYSTHSLFLVSKNYPARNRVISKGELGTRIDQKPFSKNWKAVRDSLGILLSNNFLIADKTLLVEGPSDTIYFLCALRALKERHLLDVDLNDLSIVDAGDSQNYVAMAKLMLSEGRSVVALLDGDKGGRDVKAWLEKSCSKELEKGALGVHLLPDKKSSEDVFVDLVGFRSAAKTAFERLIKDKVRSPRTGIDIEVSIGEISPSGDQTLGWVFDKVTKGWFNPPEKLSKLSVAMVYEEIFNKSELQPPETALPILLRIAGLLELKSEKSIRSGIFEEVATSA